MTKRASFLQKYWFARGYHDALATLDRDPPPIELVEYAEELAGVNISGEYDLGYEQAKKDKVNSIV